MKFDAGTWWLVAGIITITLYSSGKIIGILFNRIIVGPIEDFKKSVENLTKVIQELKEFIVKQEEKNIAAEKVFMEIKNKFSEVWDEIDEANEAIDKQKSQVAELTNRIDNYIDLQKKIKEK